MTSRPLEVWVVDDDQSVRWVLEKALKQADMETRSFERAEHLLEALSGGPPDVLITDVRMPGMSGIETLRQLRAGGVETPVVMLTMSREESDLGEALRAGARGYLLKDIDPEELAPALRAALGGEKTVARDLVGALARLIGEDAGAPQSQPPRATTPFGELTPRELEILEYVAGGYSNKMIAQALDITPGTVKLHVKSILRKLGLRSRVEAAVAAVEHGMGRRRRSSGRASDG